MFRIAARSARWSRCGTSSSWRGHGCSGSCGPSVTMLEQCLFTRKVLWALLRSLLQHVAGGIIYCMLYGVHKCEESLDDIIAGLGGFALKTAVTSDNDYAEQTHAWRDASSSRSIRIGYGGVQRLVRARVGCIARDKPL